VGLNYFTAVAQIRKGMFIGRWPYHMQKQEICLVFLVNASAGLLEGEAGKRGNL
jgi:hypothetical protein